jgi:RsiW-degrading membrane proteinase PrsW (M82 family)
VLVAALLHATWNTLIKFSGERLLVIASMDLVALVFAVLAVAFVDFRRARSGLGCWLRRWPSSCIAAADPGLPRR